MNENSVNSTSVDLFAPTNRFVSASMIYARMHRWWLIFRRYWWLVLLIFLVVLVPMYFYTLLTGPVYESKASMWVTGKLNVSDQSGYTEQLVDFLGTQAALLSSPAIERRAFDRLEAEYKGHDMAMLGKAPGPIPAAFSPIIGSSNSVQMPGSNGPMQIPFSVQVEQGSKSSTLDLKVTGRDPVATQKFLRYLMDEYLNFKKESSDKASTQAAKSLNVQEAELRNELSEAQGELHRFEASNNVVFLQQQGSSAQDYLAALNHQLAMLRTEQRLLASVKPDEWIQTDPLQGDVNNQSGRDVPGQGKMSDLQQAQNALFQADQQMHLLMAQRDELGHYLRPAHPKMLQLDRQIAQQQEIVQVSRNAVSKQLNLRREALGLQITNLEAATRQWATRSLDASSKMADYNQIQQKIGRLQNAYDKTFDLVQNIDVGQRVNQADVGVLDPASSPKPTFRMVIHMAIAVALALLLAFGTLYTIALFQDNFASPIEMAEHLAEPVLGQIPSIAMKESRGSLGAEELEQQRFEFLEAFRNIRASLLFMHNGGTRPKAIVVTSSIPEEGKSTVALYLAATLARGNSNVLLIDADMRRPSLHKYFGLTKGPGLAEMLDNEVSFANLAVPTGVKNLAVLRAGQAKRNPGDLVLSPVWPQFLDAARQQFDYILVDTPPVAATDDAAALAPRTDGVLYVVRALSTSARTARNALDMVRQRQAHVVGLVFNGSVSTPVKRQYYQSYARGYHWREDKMALNEVLPAAHYQPTANGSAANGSATNGSATNGSAANGSPANHAVANSDQTVNDDPWANYDPNATYDPSAYYDPNYYESGESEG